MAPAPAPGTVYPIAAVRLPIGVDDLIRETRKLTMQHGQDITVRQRGEHMIFYTPGEPFDGCRRCVATEAQMIEDLVGHADQMAHLQQTLILCPTCGNKRCPHATDHLNDCTGSNEPGQPGSVYA